VSKIMHMIREIFQPVPKPPPIPPPLPPLDRRPTRTERKAEALAAQTAERLRREFDRMKASPRRPIDPWGES
jgi:hypothetical protein